VLTGAGIEFAFSCLLVPVVSLTQAIFMAGLLCGRRLTWETQLRADRRLSLREAARSLWPQTLTGISLGAGLLLMAPQALAWVSPVVAGLVLAIPFAVVTSSPRLGRWLLARRLCATPEELNPPDEVQAVCPWLAALPAAKMARARPSVGGSMAGASVAGVSAAAVDASPAS
jgi:membrane glycosyltransferase